MLCLCSAAGDQCPRDMIRWVEPETPINDPNITVTTFIITPNIQFLSSSFVNFIFASVNKVRCFLVNI